MKPKKGRSPKHLERLIDRNLAPPDPSVAEVYDAGERDRGEAPEPYRSIDAARRPPGFDPAVTGGDVDVSVEDAALVGEEAPGGDNPTPGQDVVDDIGRALGVEYEDNEPLRPEEKIAERDQHRWELDPASSEDFAERKETLGPRRPAPGSRRRRHT